MKNLSVFGIQKPIVVTIYDMTTLLHPNLFPVLDVWYWQYIQRRMLRQASRVIAISKQTARDLKSFYDLPTNRIQVITPSCAPHFCPATLGKVKSVRKRYELPEYYILHVGRIDPKKNIPLLIEAFARFRQQTGFSGALVLVGEQYKKRPDRSIYDVISSLNLDDVVLLLGAVADDDLPAIYTGATISVFPSVHEGFGLVALEALACGAPLIVNKAGAVTDVVGNAALVMPSSTSESLASLLTELWNDSEKRAFLRTSGLQRAKVFSWSESARQTLAVYKEVAK
jgi:glycosyltransferase involved in cell wall biosynthesis